MKIYNRTITTVVSDFDGTLIPHGTHGLSPDFYSLAEALLDSGVRFVAASGRQYPNLKQMLAPIAGRVGFIAENGALVVWGGRVLRKYPISGGLAMELIEDMIRQPDSEILVSGEGTSYIVPNDPLYTYKLKYQVKNVVAILPDFYAVPEEMLKISIYYPGGIPEEAERFFHEKYDSLLMVVESGDGWLDFMTKDCGKGASLAFLSRELGFPLEETAAFGDGENDISMLRSAGLSFAMSSAREHVKSSADIVCDSVEEILRQALNRA